MFPERCSNAADGALLNTAAQLVQINTAGDTDAQIVDFENPHFWKTRFYGLAAKKIDHKT
jgi:hypothetical protein